jgi:riboflavin kinase
MLRRLALLGAMEGPVKVTARVLAEGMSPQTVSRRLQSLENLGYISRKIVRGGQLITITKKGKEKLRDEYAEYQQIFSPTEKIELKGRVFTGLGEGQYYMSQPNYKKQFRRKIGFLPFLGTLNLRLSEESILNRAILEKLPGIRIDGFRDEKKKRTFGGGKCFLARVAGKDVAIIMPERTHYPSDTLEIIAPFDLRANLSLKDGDEVEVEVYVR